MEPRDPVFAFELTFVRLDRGALHAHEKAFWSRHRRLVQGEKKTKRDKEDLYRVLLVLQRRLPDDLCGKVLLLALWPFRFFCVGRARCLSSGQLQAAAAAAAPSAA